MKPINKYLKDGSQTHFTCTACTLVKSREEFYKRSDPRYLYAVKQPCKRCLAPRADQYLKAKERNQNSIADIRAKVIAYLGGKCKICGISDSRVLETDHRDKYKKLFNLSGATLLKYDWSVIQMEADKCDLLCANHHLIKTHESGDLGPKIRKGALWKVGMTTDSIYL